VTTSVHGKGVVVDTRSSNVISAHKNKKGKRNKL